MTDEEFDAALGEMTIEKLIREVLIWREAAIETRSQAILLENEHTKDLQERVNELETENFLSEQRISELESEVEELESEVSNYHDYYDLRNRVDELESENCSLENQVTEIDELQQEVQDLQAIIISAREEKYSGSHDESEGYYVGSPIRNRFHRPSCEYAVHFNSTWHRWSSHQDAVAANYKPCQTCRA